MKFDVIATGTTPWKIGDLSVLREIHLKTEVGLRSQFLSLSYTKTQSGGFAPLFIILMNYVVVKPDSEKPWFGIRFSVNDLDVLLTAGMHKRATDGDTLTIYDPEEFDRVVKVLSANVNLSCEVMGEDGVLTSFPIPAEPNFTAAFNEMRQGMNAN